MDAARPGARVGRVEQRLDLGAQRRVPLARRRRRTPRALARQLERGLHTAFTARHWSGVSGAGGGRRGRRRGARVPRGHRSSSRRSHRRATDHSRETVAAETPSAAAVSSSVSPAK
jgi:hypothetical protein